MVGLDGRTIKQQTASIDVYVKPGMLEAQTLTFPGKGNQQPKQPASDLIVSLKSVEGDEHTARFSRSGLNDLIYRHKVTLLDTIQC